MTRKVIIKPTLESWRKTGQSLSLLGLSFYLSIHSNDEKRHLSTIHCLPVQWVCWGPDMGGESKAGAQKQMSAGWGGKSGGRAPQCWWSLLM